MDEQQNNLKLTKALNYAERGWQVFPVYEPTLDGGCSCGRTDCNNQGKHPRTPNGFKDATCDHEKIEAWWAEWPDANIGIVTGTGVGMFVLDIDPRHGGDASLAKLTERYGSLPKSPVVKTGGGGQHIYFKHPGDRITSRANALGDEYPGIDVRGDGAYIIAPPSTHASSGRYEWVSLGELPVAPDWLLNLLREAKRVFCSATVCGEDIPEGKRHDKLMSIALDHYRRGMEGPALLQMLLDTNRTHCRPPSPETDVHAIADWVSRLPREREDRLTDAGNADFFIAQYGWMLRYCPPKKCWYVWSGKRWEQDNRNYVQELMKTAVRSMYGMAESIANEERRKAIAAWACKSEAAYRIASAIKLAESIQDIVILPKSFDPDDWLLNCDNGTIDLKTGLLRPHDPKDLCSKISPVAYDPNASLPLFGRFLNTIVSRDEDMDLWLLKALGYSITGDVSEEKLFFVHGPTATGKSTLMEAVKATLGDYAMTLEFESLLKRQASGGIRNDIARLDGARFVVSNEVDEGKQIAEGLVKSLTGGDTITARYLYQEFFDFKFRAKLWLAANHAPGVSHSDDAMWRRIFRIPFVHAIPEGERDPAVKASLQDPKIGGPTILSFLVSGCLLWQEQGLGTTRVLVQATQEYRQDMDPLRDFFGDCCEFQTNSSDIYVLRSTFYEWYLAYAKENGITKTVTRRAFNDRLREKGCVAGTKNINGRNAAVWYGVKPLATGDDLFAADNAGAA